MATMREYFNENGCYSVEPFRFVSGGGPAEVGDAISSYRVMSAGADYDADLYLIRRAYDRDAYGRDIISESNFAVLAAWYPGTFVTISFLNVNQLAILADTELPGDLGDVLDGLSDYPLVDEDDWSHRDWEYRAECWEDYGRRDFRREIEDALGCVYGDTDDILSDDDLDCRMQHAEEQGGVIAEDDGGGYVWVGSHELVQKIAWEVAHESARTV